MKEKQNKIIKDNNTLKGYTLLPTGSTVTVQRVDSWLWIHDRDTDHRNSDHNGRSYKIRIMKTGRVVKRTARQANTTPILPEQYLRDHI